jgi:hypothetical protein
MSNDKFTLYTDEEISNWILQTPSNDIKEGISSLSPQQLSIAVAALDNPLEQNLREKLAIIVEAATDNRDLEAIGRALSLRQALHILDKSAQTDQNGHWKLSPIIVGMPHGVFTQMLIVATPIQLKALKQEAITEAIQHHLTVLTHEIIHQVPEISASLDDLEQEIAQLDVAEMGYPEVKSIIHRIEQYAQQYEEMITKINNGLALAWNTNRTDLIDKLSQAKEISKKFIESIMGSKKTASNSTGLFLKLEKRLNEVFGNSEDVRQIEAFNDDEPAIEALVKFSIWYLKDYWELGLLPEISTEEALDLDFTRFSNQQRMDYREKLYQQVIENLAKIGLQTVRDLKLAKIFSRKILEEYIHSHRLI